MKAADVLQMQIERMAEEFKQTLGDLTPEQLAWRPARSANSIGFLLWHVARVWDGYLRFLDDAPDLYVKNRWTEQFGFETEGRGIGGTGVGTGFTDQDVGLVKPQPETLSEYIGAVFARTKKYLDAAAEDTLAREVRVPWWPQSTTQAFVLAHIIRHSYQHLGEAQYVRGLSQTYK